MSKEVKIDKLEELLEFFSSAPNKTASSWETSMIRWPHGATSNSGNNERNFLNRAREEEENAKAPAIKPYPLNFISDNIVQIYDSLCQLRTTLKTAMKYPDVTRSDIKILQQEIKKVNSFIDNLESMHYNIEKISL